MKNRKYIVILTERGTGRKMCEADSLFSMYSHYTDKINHFNIFNKIVTNTTGFKSNECITNEIPVNREMFDKLYQGALLLKLPIDMTFNYDTELWYLTVKYKAQELCFTHNDN